DRDGVVIEDCHYIKDPKDVSLCPGLREFIRFFYQKRIPIVIVTNQSGISKNYLSWNDYEKVTEQLLSLLGTPNPITAIYANSYTSTIPEDNWRKPNPNMILQASNDLNLDLKRSILIGDRETDLVAGFRAEIPQVFHVHTGHGKKERKTILEKYSKGNLIEPELDYGKINFLETLEEFPFDKVLRFLLN
ncbi:HAD-IIIA family hydrolase, partial [Prochlorococcus sp. AH-716-M09]|nr:HAD-IIIA family hydrolase [Prochlorococcus sp. AH-716-M09]